jgi:hypothetical protein
VSDPAVIPDDEILLRHIPGGTRWQAPGPRITSGNFELRKDWGETGISVTRQSITSPGQLLSLLQTTPGSRVAAVRVAHVRSLGLRVVPKPLDSDPGHAEIQSDTASLDDHLVRKRLANAFQFLDLEPGSEASP